MERMLGILLVFLLTFSSCSSPQQQGTAEPPQQELAQIGEKMEKIPLTDQLSLKQSQQRELMDYEQNLLLIAVYDTDLVDPLGNAVNDARYPYLEKFIVFNLDEQTIQEELSVGQFAFCKSAVFAFDGVLSALSVSTEGDQNGSGLYFSNNLGTKLIHDAATEFGPCTDSIKLFRTDTGVSYEYNSSDNGYGDNNHPVWGLKRSMGTGK